MVKPKVRIVTADFGNHINNFKYVLPHQLTKKYQVNFQCFTDKNTSSRKLSLHPRTKSKIPKMLDWLENDADYYIWFDSKFKVINNNFVDQIIDELGDSEIGLMKHPSRKSILEELLFMEQEIKLGETYLINRYEGERMREQVEFYLKDNEFVDDKLFGMGFFIYTKKLVENKSFNLLTDWFFNNCYWSVQDQLSFPYVLQKHKTKYKTFDLPLFNNKHLKWK